MTTCNNGTHMTTETDLDQFRTPEALLEYCRRQLGEPRRQGREQVFPCPFGTHERPKLSVGERDGRGVFHCWSCDESGDIFQLAAHMAGTNVKTDFPAAVRHVADVLGVCLPEDDRPGASRPGGRPPLPSRRGLRSRSFFRQKTSAPFMIAASACEWTSKNRMNWHGNSTLTEENSSTVPSFMSLMGAFSA